MSPLAACEGAAASSRLARRVISFGRRERCRQLPADKWLPRPDQTDGRSLIAAMSPSRAPVTQRQFRRRVQFIARSSPLTQPGMHSRLASQLELKTGSAFLNHQQPDRVRKNTVPPSTLSQHCVARQLGKNSLVVSREGLKLGFGQKSRGRVKAARVAVVVACSSGGAATRKSQRNANKCA